MAGETLIVALAGVNREEGKNDEEANENNQNDSHSFADCLLERVHLRRTGNSGSSGLGGGERDVGEENGMDKEAGEDMSAAEGWRGHLEKEQETERNRERDRDKQHVELRPVWKLGDIIL